MDATELHELLEIYRENLTSQLTTTARTVIKACTDVARDHKIAAKHLVHVIEQHTARVSPLLPFLPVGSNTIRRDCLIPASP